MNLYAFENWPTDGSGIRIASCHYKDTDQVEDIRIKGSPRNWSLLHSSREIPSHGHGIQRIEIDMAAYRGLVDALELATDVDDVKSYETCLDIINMGVDVKSAEAFYLSDPELQARRVRRAFQRDGSLAKKTMSHLIDNDAVFEHAYRSLGDESGTQRNFMDAALYETLTAPLESQLNERKTRLAKYLMHRYPENANPASVALLLDDADIEKPMKAGATIRLALMRKPEKAMDLPEGFAP